MQIESFVSDVVPRLESAQAALYGGDASRWRDLWSRHGEVSWLGQFGTCAVGIDDVLAHYDRVADRGWLFDGFELEVLAADVFGDHGYLVTRESARVKLGAGDPPMPPARVSRVLERDAGVWRVTHGHADLDPRALDLPWKPPRPIEEVRDVH
ncbi:nuclear transport factor 2 family protein [Microbacterium sp. AZCO]|uniref:YybH family protein n=1 Tax=Microbacterium sp. AZCO TaxID=3142976 RepID=UPI0031F33B44